LAGNQSRGSYWWFTAQHLTFALHACKLRPHSAKRGADLLPMRCCSGDCGMPGYPSSNTIGHAKFYTCSHDVVIRVYDAAGNVIETQAHASEFKEW
jgi:hypothetical protein